MIHAKLRFAARASLMRYRVGADQRSSSKCNAGFTLIELLSVVLVISILAALTIKIAGYVQQRALKQTTKAQIAMLEAGLDAFKADFGYYPTTTVVRSSNSGYGESTNNNCLYNALFTEGRRYVNFPQSQIRIHNLGSGEGTFLTNIFDVYGMPFNYYNSPTNAFKLKNNTQLVDYNTGYAEGGQVNKNSYDLFSYGPDQLTYVPFAKAYEANYPWHFSMWSNKVSAVDDIANFEK